MAPSVSSLKNLDLSLLAQRLGRLCQQLHVEVTTAESCTGGGIASAITSVAGSSAYFTAGYVTYSNAAKTRLLGVEPALLEAHGAVSEAVVGAMVAGACRDSGADRPWPSVVWPGRKAVARRSRWAPYGWPGAMPRASRPNAFIFRVTGRRCASRRYVKPWQGWSLGFPRRPPGNNR